MPVFTYQGTNKVGTKVTGERTANTKDELKASLRREQINVSKLSEKGKEFSIPSFGSGVDSKELAIFTRQFSVMIDAGLPLVQCLEILAGQQENKTFQKILNGTRASVEGGTTLSAAMKQYDKVFDALYYNMVEAGETGGILDTILQRLVELHREKRKTETRGEVRDDLPDRRAGYRGRGHYPSIVEGRADFHHFVQRSRRGPAAANQNCDHDEQLHRQHLWIDDSGVFRGDRVRFEVLVRNTARALRDRQHLVKTAVDWNSAAQDCGSTIHANLGNVDL